MTLKQQAVLFRTSQHSGPLEVELTRRNIPFVKFGGLKFLDSAHVKDMLAVLRFAQNPRDRVAGFRLLQMLPGIGPQTAGKILDTIAADPEPLMALAEIPAPPKTGERLAGAFVQLLQELLRKSGGWPAEIALARLWYEPHLDRIHEDADTRKADLLQLEQIASGYAVARTLSHRTDARSAGCDQRPGRRAAARRGLSDPVDHPFGQGPGMARGLHAERRRWLHTVRSRVGTTSRDRGGAPAALCWHDAGEGQSDADHAATLLHHGQNGRATGTSMPRAPASFRHAAAIFREQSAIGPVS
jgi:hypothetical protein